MIPTNFIELAELGSFETRKEAKRVKKNASEYKKYPELLKEYWDYTGDRRWHIVIDRWALANYIIDKTAVDN